MAPSWFVVALLVAFSQQGPPAYRGATEGSRPANTLAGPPLGAVHSTIKGAPYCAEVEWDNTVQKPTGPIHTVLHGRDCRDSLGRYFRDAEIPMKGNTPELNTFRHTTILDPVEGRLIYLNPTYKFGQVFKVPKPAPVEQPATKNRDENREPSQNIEELGTKEVAGLIAHGTRIKYPVTQMVDGQPKPSFRTVETWFVDDLKLSVLTITSEADGSVYIMRLSDIQHVEPDPVLFQIPEGYRIREMEGGPVSTFSEAKP